MDKMKTISTAETLFRSHFEMKGDKPVLTKYGFWEALIQNQTELISFIKEKIENKYSSEVVINADSAQAYEVALTEIINLIEDKK